MIAGLHGPHGLIFVLQIILYMQIISSESRQEPGISEKISVFTLATEGVSWRWNRPLQDMGTGNGDPWGTFHRSASTDLPNLENHNSGDGVLSTAQTSDATTRISPRKRAGPRPAGNYSRWSVDSEHTGVSGSPDKLPTRAQLTSENTPPWNKSLPHPYTTSNDHRVQLNSENTPPWNQSLPHPYTTSNDSRVQLTSEDHPPWNKSLPHPYTTSNDSRVQLTSDNPPPWNKSLPHPYTTSNDHRVQLNSENTPPWNQSLPHPYTTSNDSRVQLTSEDHPPWNKSLPHPYTTSNDSRVQFTSEDQPPWNKSLPHPYTTSNDSRVQLTSEDTPSWNKSLPHPYTTSTDSRVQLTSEDQPPWNKSLPHPYTTSTDSLMQTESPYFQSAPNSTRPSEIMISNNQATLTSTDYHTNSNTLSTNMPLPGGRLALTPRQQAVTTSAGHSMRTSPGIRQHAYYTLTSSPVQATTMSRDPQTEKSSFLLLNYSDFLRHVQPSGLVHVTTLTSHELQQNLTSSHLPENLLSPSNTSSVIPSRPGPSLTEVSHSRIEGIPDRNASTEGPPLVLTTTSDGELKLLWSSPLDSMAAVSQKIFSDAFSWIKRFSFWLKFHCSLFLRVKWTISQHWFR